MAKKTIEKIKCTCCGRNRLMNRDFYKSASELNAYTGRLNICKECVQNRYEKLLTVYNGNSTNAFRHLLMNLDEYFDEELYNSCVIKDGINFIGDYFRQVNGTKDRRDKTSLNNLINNTSENKEMPLDVGSISEKLILEWGQGREKEDYIMLEKRYQELLKDFPSESPEERYIIKDICKIEKDIDECRKLGKTDKIASLENVKSKKMAELDAIPSKKKKEYDENSNLIFGNIMRIYEQEKPVLDKLGIYKDTDGIHQYWYDNLIKPMMKATKYAEGEYSLEHGADNIIISNEIKQFMADDRDG